MSGMRKVLLSMLVGAFICAGCDSPAPKEAILTQKPTLENRIQITVLVKYAFSINAFEKIVEEKFPRLDLIQVNNFTYNRGITEYSRRLEHDDLTDIVMTWPLDVGKHLWKDRLLDLSGMSFTSQYSASMLNKIAREDGKLYYLPGPAQIRAIVYNKTLFEENGWEVPASFEDFIALCKQIEASGIRSIQLGFGTPEVLDTAFIGFNYGSSFSTPADAQWLDNYNRGHGSLEDHFGTALDTFQRMIDEGIWKKTDLNKTYAQCETMLFTRKAAMIEDSALIARIGYGRTGIKDTFALMPFQNPGTPSDWARLFMVCYIGLNKHLIEPQNKEKYDLVLRLMDYISTPEGQNALSADTGAMISSVRNASPPHSAEIRDLKETLRRGRYAIFPELTRAKRALHQGLAGMIAGTHTKDDVIRMVDMQNVNPPDPVKPEIIGTATEDFTLIETGNFVTDIMRAKTGASIALFLDNGKDGRANSKGLTARLYKGPQTVDDVLCLLASNRSTITKNLQIVTMTGKDLIRTLEYSIAVDNNRRGWFYYFSGLRMDFVPTANPGSRILSLTDMEGKEIDPQRVYTVAIMADTVPENAVKSLINTGISMADLLVEAIRQKQTVSPSLDGRLVLYNP